MNILPDHIIHFNEADELRIVINEIFTMSKNLQFGYDKCCYWIVWLFQWELLHKKNKSSFNIDKRDIQDIPEKLKSNMIWILWNIILEEMKIRNNEDITKQILSLYNLYKFNY